MDGWMDGVWWDTERGSSSSSFVSLCKHNPYSSIKVSCPVVSLWKETYLVARWPSPSLSAPAAAHEEDADRLSYQLK